MACLWNDLVRVHRFIRKRHWRWPSQAAFDTHFVRRKARYNGISSASIQQATRKFFGNLRTTRENRRLGLPTRYPWRSRKRYQTVIFRGNTVTRVNGCLRLPVGHGDAILVPAADLSPDADVRKVELCYDEILVTVREETADRKPDDGRVSAASDLIAGGGDPGQRWAQTVVTEGGSVLMVSGRGIVSEKVRHQKRLAHLRSRLDTKRRGSRRSRKLRRSIARERARCRRRVRNANHKVSRRVTDFLETEGVGVLYQGDPEGIATARGRKAQRQRNALWEYGEQARMIAYKGASRVEPVDERGSSSSCPRCGKRVRPAGRLFRCPCGFLEHRDVVGAQNILLRHVSHAGPVQIRRIKYLRAWQPPLRGPRRARSSEGGTLRVPEVLAMPDGQGVPSGTKWLARAYGEVGAPPLAGPSGAGVWPVRIREESDEEVRAHA